MFPKNKTENGYRHGNDEILKIFLYSHNYNFEPYLATSRKLFPKWNLIKINEILNIMNIIDEISK